MHPMEPEPSDTISIAPSVLITIAQHAAESVKGVARMGQVPVDVVRMLRGQPSGHGVMLQIDDQDVACELYLVVTPGANMRDVSRSVQRAVKRAIEELVGMTVTGINVHIEDVDHPG